MTDFTDFTEYQHASEDAQSHELRWVDQTLFGSSVGNCFAACVASILNVSLASVPNFCASEDWWQRFVHWLDQRELTAIRVDGEPTWLPDGALAIVSGPSDRGLMHATVWRGQTMVHDPHPSRAGLVVAVDAVLIFRMDPRVRSER